MKECLILSYGFTERIKGDHHIYKRNDIIERIVIQPLGNKAKAYQVKQVRNLFIKYGL
jgi:predicted RNA binding protein YcfA (HicA-like mRNA interferase family)